MNQNTQVTQPDLRDLAKTIKLSKIDIDAYEFKVYDLYENSLGSTLFNKNKKQHDRKLARTAEILKVIGKYTTSKEIISPTGIKSLLEDLGPTFVKIGQILSRRTELLPKEYCKELETLCINAKPLEYDIIKQVIEQELNAEVDQIFSHIDKTPIGSASIAQAHRATLKDGTNVVIKVQRPGVDTAMRQDIMLLKSVFRMTNFIKVFKNIDISDLLNEIWKTTQQELNFFVEAINTIKFRQFSENYELNTCPIVYREYTTRKILTMEYVDGYDINHLPDNVDKTALGSQIAHNYISQILKNEFFHADPHQGNILIRIHEDRPEIVWIDFGLVYQISTQEQFAIKQLITAITQRDIEGVIQSVLTLTVQQGELDYSKLYNDVDFLLTKYSNIDLKNIKINEVFTDMLNAVRTHNLQVTSALSMLSRGLITIEGVLTNLTNELNLMEILKSYVMQDMFSYKNIKQLVEETTQTTLSTIKQSIEIPVLYKNLLRNTIKGVTKVNLKIEHGDADIREFREFVFEICVTLIICALIIGSFICCAYKIEPFLWNLPSISVVGFVCAIILSLILLIRRILKK